MNNFNYFCIDVGWRKTPCAHGLCAEREYKKPPYAPSRPMRQEEWRVLLRDTTRFYTFAVVAVSVIACILGILIGWHFG